MGTIRRDDRSKDAVVVEGVLIHKTDKAMLVLFEDAGKVWIPCSLLVHRGIMRDQAEQEVTLFPQRWICEREFIEYEEYNPDDWVDYEEEERVEC